MRDESEFVWAVDGNGDQVYVPRTHLEVFGDALTEVKPGKPANPTPATPDKPKEK